MGAEQTPKCTNDAHSVHALMNEMKSLLSPSVLESGAVLVGLLPKHRCCAGSCHGVEPRENKEIRENEETRDNKESQDNEEIQENKETQEIKHPVEGLWEAASGGLLALVHTVQDRPGYLFGTLLVGNSVFPAKTVFFWVRSGDGNVLEGRMLRQSIYSFNYSF